MIGVEPGTSAQQLEPSQTGDVDYSHHAAAGLRWFYLDPQLAAPGTTRALRDVVRGGA